MGITIDRLLIVQLVNWINSRLDEIPLPCPLLIGSGEDTGEQLWIQALAGTTKAREYADGGYIGNLPFAVYYQQTNPENPAALDVPLWNLAQFFESHSPALDIARAESVEMTSTPNAFFRGEDGTGVNQAVFRLNFSKGVY